MELLRVNPSRRRLRPASGLSAAAEALARPAVHPALLWRLQVGQRSVDRNTGQWLRSTA
jgi:hypothetical protein